MTKKDASWVDLFSLIRFLETSISQVITTQKPFRDFSCKVINLILLTKLTIWALAILMTRKQSKEISTRSSILSWMVEILNKTNLLTTVDSQCLEALQLLWSTTSSRLVKLIISTKPLKVKHHHFSRPFNSDPPRPSNWTWECLRSSSDTNFHQSEFNTTWHSWASISSSWKFVPL